jgi:hypothetical protein
MAMQPRIAAKCTMLPSVPADHQPEKSTSEKAMKMAVTPTMAPKAE